MYNQILCALVIIFAISAVFSDDFTSQNEILDYENDRDPIIYGIKNESVVHPNIPKVTWFDSARNALAGPAGKIVVTMAKEMIARSTGNSQILSLNLTNLLILVLLKALIFAAGLVGAGNGWGQYGRARNNDPTLIRADEAPLFIGYLALEGSGDGGCLNRAACKTPGTAKEYLRAARAVVKGAEILDSRFANTTYSHSYTYTLNQLEQAIRKGFDGASCDSIYNCNF